MSRFSVKDTVGFVGKTAGATVKSFLGKKQQSAPSYLEAPNEAEHHAFTMEDEYDFDVIVVGAGVAGTVCAYQLAKEGHEVLLIERGMEPGAKNMSGGIFYTHAITEVFEDFVDRAPIERVITRNSLMFLDGDSAVSLDAWNQGLADPVNAVSVLRAKLDPWLAEQCEDAGVTLMSGVRVDELVTSERCPGQFIGVRAGEDVVTARIIVLADGVNSFLARQAGLRPTPALAHRALGMKSIIRLGEDTVRDRFALRGEEGAALHAVGAATAGLSGGGFLYTNRDTVSVGVVVRLSDLDKSGLSSSDIHDSFVKHPRIAPYLEGGELLEYGAHLVNEGGQAMMNGLIGPGVLIVGDAAGFTLNTGFTIRGMDFAAGSAVAAARAAHQALCVDNYSRNQMRAYLDDIARSWVGKDMASYAGADEVLTNPLVFNDIPDLIGNVFKGIYTHNRKPHAHLGELASRELKKSPLGVSDVLSVGYKAIKGM